ncbi:MAG: AraC family transcriptional regulator [Myxococcota bacterium]
MAAQSKPPDPILDVFRDLRLTQSRYLKSTLTAPWGLRIPAWDWAVFHFVARGTCVIRVGDATDEIGEGDFVVLPHGAEHELLDEVDSSVHVLYSLPSEGISALGCSLNHGGDGTSCVVISGGFVFEPHPVVSDLPAAIYVRRAETGSENHTARLVASLVEEVAIARPGSETVVNRLADVLVIGAIRHWLDTVSDDERGWSAALRHTGLGRALALIHTDATKPYKLEDLAAEAGMSRANFAKTFAEYVGTSPMQFLSHRRMQLATRWLRDDVLTISEVSNRLGYSSEAAFSRAFKRYTGNTPGVVARSRNPH